MDKSLQQEFLQLMSQHQGLLHKIGLLYARSEEERKDLLQDMLLQLWQAFPTFKGQSKISTWMYRVALNTAISGFRKTSRKPAQVELTERHHWLEAEPPGELEAQFAELQRLIETLPEVEKALLLLYLDGNSYDEISDVLGITPNHARVKMSRLREKLKSRVSDGIG